MSEKKVTIYGNQTKISSLELKFKKKFTYGLHYPFTRRHRGQEGFFTKTTGIASRITEVLQLIKTDPGTRVMLPNYGAGLSQYLFQPNLGLNLNKFLFEQIDEDILDDIREGIQASIEDYLPEVEVLSIDIGPKTELSISQPPLSTIDPYNVDLIESNTIRVAVRLRNRDLQDIFSVVVGPSGEQIATSTVSEGEDTTLESYTSGGGEGGGSSYSGGGY